MVEGKAGPARPGPPGRNKGRLSSLMVDRSRPLCFILYVKLIYIVNSIEAKISK